MNWDKKERERDIQVLKELESLKERVNLTISRNKKRVQLCIDKIENNKKIVNELNEKWYNVIKTIESDMTKCNKLLIKIDRHIADKKRSLQNV